MYHLLSSLSQPYELVSSCILQLRLTEFESEPLVLQLNDRTKSQISPGLSSSRVLDLSIISWCSSNLFILFYFSGPEFLHLANLGEIRNQLCQGLGVSLGMEILEGTPVFNSTHSLGLV